MFYLVLLTNLKVYRLPVYDEHGNKLSVDVIYSNLRKLHDLKELNEKQMLFGHLTADERQLWAPIHEQLSSSKIFFSRNFSIVKHYTKVFIMYSFKFH